VVEEFMEGEELSVFALCDGRVLPMLPSQDHKRVGEGDTGPNTGGMGAYAPVSLATPALMERIAREMLEPTVAAMAEEGRPFRGLLYAGLMLTPAGPRVVEFNCRFGDPETQVVLPMLADSLLQPLVAIARGGSIEGLRLRWRPGAAVTTVLSAPGYPGEYPSGAEIAIPADLEAAGDVLVFHAGTRRDGERTVTSGGRVLAVTGLGPDVATAAARSRTPPNASASTARTSAATSPGGRWREVGSEKWEVPGRRAPGIPADSARRRDFASPHSASTTSSSSSCLNFPRSKPSSATCEA
jgi:phosphoribosylamine---glycine ligase